MARALALLTLLAALAAAGVAHAAAAGRVACGTKSLDFYFWPHGHGAVASIGFPAYPPPHMEVYKGGSVADKDELAFVGAGTGGFAKSCKKVADTVTRWGGGPLKTVTTPGKASCTFPQTAEEKLIAGAAGSAQLIITLGHTPATVLYASVAATGSKLQLDTRYCRFTAIKA